MKQAGARRVGVAVCGLYIALVIGLYVYTARPKPGYDGMEWIPFMVLIMPWSTLKGIDWTVIVAGALINTGILYLVGYMIGLAWRALTSRRSENGAGR